MTKPILCVVTSATAKGETGIPTGFWLSELTHALKEMEDAGHKTLITSIRGGQAPIDKDSLDFNDPVNKYFWEETDLKDRLANTPSVSELKGTDYKAIFFAGGHGTMWDFRDNPDVQRLIREVYESNGVVSAVCHGPAALVDVKLSNGEYFVKGKNLAAFTNKEEDEVQGTAIVPYLLESALVAHGAIHHEAPNWSENVIVDGRLVTGQNPASAHKVGVELVNVLSQKATQ